jgi:hypothetical protein
MIPSLTLGLGKSGPASELRIPGLKRKIIPAVVFNSCLSVLKLPQIV